MGIATSEEQRPRTIKRKLRVEPKFHQVDMMGVVHNVQYLYWFEEGRLQILCEIMPMDEALRLGVAMPVVKSVCVYKKAVRLGDALVLHTAHEIQSRYTGRLVFTHSLVNEKNKIEMACGETAVTIVDAQTLQLARELPPEAVARYNAL